MTYQDVVNIIRDAANYVNPDGFFVHGRKTDGSLQYNEATPQIILLEPQPNTSINNNNFFETTVFPIIFVTQDSPESTEVERENIKQSMYLLSRKLLAKIDEQPLLQDVQYTGGQPEIRQLSGTMTGFSYSLQLSYPLSECSLDFDLPPTIKLFATQTIVASGTTIQIGWIAENVNSVVITPFGTLQGQFGFVNTTINSTTSFVGTATNDAGTATDTLIITVSNGCDDATAVLKNTAGTTLSTTDIPSGDTQDIIAPNGHVHIKKENDGTIANVFPPSGATLNYIVQDSDVEVNGVLEGSVHAEETVDIQLEDSGGNPVTPTSVNQSGNTFTIEVPSGGLTVDFSADDTTPDTNQTVTFTDATVGATSWLWDFGDGNLSTLQNPTHQYRYAGTYTVTLYASDGTAEGVEIKSNYIVVTLQAILATDLQASYLGADYDAATGTWTDITSGFNLTQAIVANRPSKSVGINGYDVVTGDGLNDFVVNSDAGFTRGAEHTIAFLLRHDAGSTALRVLAASPVTFPVIYTQPASISYRIDNPTNRNTYTGCNITEYTLVIFGFSDSGNAYSLINDTLVPVANTGAGGYNGLSLFASATGTLPMAVTIAECRVYSTLKTGADLTNIANYFKSKYSLW